MNLLGEISCPAHDYTLFDMSDQGRALYWCVAGANCWRAVLTMKVVMPETVYGLLFKLYCYRDVA